MTTFILVKHDYTVAAGQVLNDTVFTIAAAHHDASLFVDGSISEHSSASVVRAVFCTGQEDYKNSIFWIGATGSLAVVGEDGNAGAWGYYCASWGPDFRNSGTFSVTSVEGAVGAEMDFGGANFLNEGAYLVSGGNGAVGVSVEDVVNTGTMTVSGGSQQAVAVRMAHARNTLVNSGSITAEDTSGSVQSIAIQSSFSIFFTKIENSGTITGDYAILGTITDSTPYGYIQVSNSGVMTGIVSLGLGSDLVTNSGTMHGDLFLGTGNDNYTGDLGWLDGAMYGGIGDDTLTGGNSDDTIFGDEAAQSPDDGNDALFGGPGNDLLVGQGGNDTIDGGDGNDTAGYDTAPVAVVVDLSIAGPQDTVGAGIDKLTGIENVSGSAFGDVLTGDGGDNVLQGNAGNDTLAGNGGNDTLDGGEGTDTLSGGNGNDIYVVDSASDVVIEQAGAGVDTVLSTASSFILAPNIENLTYVGSGDFVGGGNSGANIITGGGHDDKISGGEGNDVLVGGAGDDTLKGGAGQDMLIGGKGNDIYVVTDAADVLVEAPNEGRDTVRTILTSWALAVDFENLSYAGTGAFVGTGNDMTNALTGGAGDDVLSGKGGADVLRGGDGADSFAFSAVTDSSGTVFDHIVDFNGAADKVALWFTVTGYDGAFATKKFATIDTTLGATHLGAHHAALVATNHGQEFLVIDANGIAGYQSGSDLIIRIDGGTNLDSIDSSTFV